MQIRRLILAFLLMTASSGIAQSPNDGMVRGSSYENSYFKFSYVWPVILRPYDTASLHVPQSSPYANEFLLFSARQGDEPYGVVVLAVRLNTITPHSKGIRDGADFLDRVARFNPQQTCGDRIEETFHKCGRPRLRSTRLHREWSTFLGNRRTDREVFDCLQMQCKISG